MRILLSFITLLFISCETKVYIDNVTIGDKPLPHEEGIPIEKIKKKIFDSEINSDEFREFVTITPDSVDSIALKLLSEDENPEDYFTESNQVQVFYNIIIDTNRNYKALNKIMYEASKSLNCNIDTMGRYFND